MKTKFEEMTATLRSIADDTLMYWQCIAMAYEGYVKVLECPRETEEYVNSLLKEEYDYIRNVKF